MTAPLSGLMERVAQDLRFAVRHLRKNPAFAVTAVLMTSLGLAASVAIFAFVDAAFLAPLPYTDPSRLVGVFESIAIFPRSNLSYLDYLDWKRLNTVFTSLEAYQRTGSILTTAAGVERASGARVSDGFFRTLGVAPILGRDFQPGEDLPGASRTVILSYATWQQRFAGDPGILGRALTLDGAPTIVVGVLPRTFHFAPVEPAGFWTTLHASGTCDTRRGCHNLYGVARLRDGVSLETALANVKGIARQLEAQYPDSNRDQGAALATLADVIAGDIRPILLVLLGGAVLLLLIANVNVASLLVVRAEGRTREVAVRSALGASPGRLRRQFVTEGLVLTSAGAGLGLVGARWTMALLMALFPADMLARMTYLHGVGLHPRVLVFAGGVAMLAALVTSLTPVVRWSVSGVHTGLAEGSRGSAGTAWRRVGSRLVVLELATATVLVCGAGLLGKSLYRLLHVEVGLRPDRLVTMQVAAPRSVYSSDEKVIRLHRQILSRIASLPGVESAGTTSQLPISGNGNTTWFRVLGRPWHGEHNEVPERYVSPGYFTTLGATLVRGRYFTEEDGPSRPAVAIVNRTFERQYFPGEDPLAAKVAYLRDPPVPMAIVGVVEDIREGPLGVAIPAVLYVPSAQNPGSGFGLVVRTAQAEPSILRVVSNAIRDIDPGIVTAAPLMMEDRIGNSPSASLHRSSAWLVGGFAALALLLGVVGVYGVIAYSVSQRTREIGVRMALGAERRSVYRLILQEAGWLTAIGLALGLAGSIAAAGTLRGLFFGIRPWDAATLTAAAVVLAAATLLASYVPARRAASVNPIEALRTE